MKTLSLFLSLLVLLSPAVVQATVPSAADSLPRNFEKPPPGYGEVAFYWWLGDPLTQERLGWQLERLSGMGISGLQINYAHSDKGGPTWGLTYPSIPALYSKEWWSLVGWFMGEAKSRGMAVSLSDYTLGIGQGWAFDEALAKYPQTIGYELKSESRRLAPKARLDWALPAGTLLSLKAFPDAQRSGGGGGEAIDLSSLCSEGRVRWQAPDSGAWTVLAVWSAARPSSLNPMHPQAGPAIVEAFFQPWEDRHPGEAGKGINFFFSDELNFNLMGRLWGKDFAEEFKRRKGYDLVPEIAGLFRDIGPRTPKLRLDYNDVLVQLSEDGFFKPIYDWHQKRGMIFGCDHGGRGRDVIEFGDYFRTQRWTQGPGSDQPQLGRDLIKAKVAASIAHLYERPRVWLEGYYGSGWGTSSAEVVDASFANFVLGYNLLTLHGLYYSTHGGWWEWAPPCNHFHMPYYSHTRGFMQCMERLSYLLSQGKHVCDVAVLYPVAAMEEGRAEGKPAVDTAFGFARELHAAGRDFDFMDFQSLERAKSAGGKLSVAGEKYGVLVLPSMKTVRHSTLENALGFARAGGLVVVIGDVPEASERVGREDPQLHAMVAELLGSAGAVRCASVAEAVSLVLSRSQADFELEQGVRGSFQHRRISGQDVFALYGMPAGAIARFRASGKVELWNPWDGTRRPLPVLSSENGLTRLALPLGESEMQLLVFSPGEPLRQSPAPSAPPREAMLAGPWQATPEPSLDNRFGDYHWPATPRFIGPEGRRLRSVPEALASKGWQQPGYDDSAWPVQTVSFGTKFLQLGPLPEKADVTELESQLLSTGEAPSAGQVRSVAGVPSAWKPYSFSWRWGVEGDQGHQGYHGLKALLYDEFIRLGVLDTPRLSSPQQPRKPAPEGSRYYLWTTVAAPRRMRAALLIGGKMPERLWLRGQALEPRSAFVELEAGANAVLLRYDQIGNGYVVFTEEQSPLAKEVGTPPSTKSDERQTEGSLAMRWHGQPGVLDFDPRPADPVKATCFRVKTPPGLKAFELRSAGTPRVWLQGEELRGKPAAAAGEWRFELAQPLAVEGTLALRCEASGSLSATELLPEPLRYECEKAPVQLGDWSLLEGFASYSGGMRYTLRFDGSQVLGGANPQLDLGDLVSSAEVWVNGKSAGVRVSPPWRYELGGLVKPGENVLEILVQNTLANHYLTVPTRYRGKPRSGLFGPVRLLWTP